jgi:hypothetical protein
MRRELIVNALMIVVGAIFSIESLRLGIGGIHRPGPGMLPLFTGIALGLVATFSLIKYLVMTKGNNGQDDKFFGHAIYNVIIISISLVAYVLLLPWLGYLTATVMLLVFLFKAGGFRKWGWILLSSLATSSVTYLVFSYWLHLRFPQGIFGF